MICIYLKVMVIKMYSWVKIINKDVFPIFVEYFNKQRSEEKVYEMQAG